MVSEAAASQFLSPSWASLWWSVTCTACVCPRTALPSSATDPLGLKSRAGSKAPPCGFCCNVLMRCCAEMSAGSPALLPPGMDQWDACSATGVVPGGMSALIHIEAPWWDACWDTFYILPSFKTNETKHLNICNFFPSPQCTECVLCIDKQKHLNFCVYRLCLVLEGMVPNGSSSTAMFPDSPLQGS